MSVTSFKEIHDGRQGDDGERSISAVRVFRAVTNSNYDNQEQVLTFDVAAAGPGVEAGSVSCPKLGAVHPDHQYMRVKTRSARNEGHSKRVWLVTINYSSAAVEIDPDDPLADPAVITWRPEQYTVVAEVDNEGNAILNSAGDYYDPPPEKNASKWTVSVVKNLGFVPDWLLLYQDTVNNSPFVLDGLVIQRRLAYMQGVEVGGWQSRNDIPYRVVTFTLSLTKQRVKRNGAFVYLGHALSLMDRGFNKRLFEGITPAELAAGGRRVKIQIRDDEGTWIDATDPQHLDGAGGVLENPTPATTVFNTYYIYEELDFNFLPLI